MGSLECLCKEVLEYSGYLKIRLFKSSPLFDEGSECGLVHPLEFPYTYASISRSNYSSYIMYMICTYKHIFI